ncbi:MAG: hypothetical protein Q8J63_06990 [Candidatus Aquicultor sp.]|nr:hypothetical protein [Candidatus Aquicultor sp.]
MRSSIRSLLFRCRRTADRFRTERGRDAGGGELVMTKWSTPIKEYGTFNRLRLPVRSQAIRHLESGDYSYIKLEITEIEYGHPSLYR